MAKYGEYKDGRRIDRPLYVPRKVRQWAREQGLFVAEQGRITFSVLAAYQQAHKKEK